MTIRRLNTEQQINQFEQGSGYNIFLHFCMIFFFLLKVIFYCVQIHFRALDVNLCVFFVFSRVCCIAYACQLLMIHNANYYSLFCASYIDVVLHVSFMSKCEHCNYVRSYLEMCSGWVQTCDLSIIPLRSINKTL